MHAFINLVVCEAIPLKSNQDRVIQLFKNSVHMDLTSYYMCDDPSSLPYRARKAAMLAMKDGDGWATRYVKVLGSGLGLGVRSGVGSGPGRAPAYWCMRVWRYERMHGCMGVWAWGYGCVGAWAYGYIGASVYECMTYIPTMPIIAHPRVVRWRDRRPLSSPQAPTLMLPRRYPSPLHLHTYALTHHPPYNHTPIHPYTRATILPRTHTHTPMHHTPMHPYTHTPMHPYTHTPPPLPLGLLKTSILTIRLLISCCFGDFTLAKQKCQSICRPGLLLPTLLDQSAAWNLRAMLLHLFATLYIHSTTFTKGLVVMPAMRMALQLMSDLINQYVVVVG